MARISCVLNWLFAAVGIFAATSLQSFAKDQRVSALAVEAALRMHYFRPFSTIAFSPTGKLLAYVVQDNENMSSFDREALLRTGIAFTRTDICVIDTDTGEAKTLTTGKGANWAPVWSPDGHLLAFLSDRDGSGQARVWVWDLATNAMQRVSDVNVRGDDIEWMPDSHRLFVTTVPDGFTVNSYVRTLTLKTQGPNPSEVDAVGSTLSLYQSNPDSQANTIVASDPWNLDYFLRDLRLVDVISGKSTTVVRAQRIGKYLVSPDGSQVAYTRPLRFEKPGSQQTLFDLVTVDVTTVQERVLGSGIRLDYDGAAFSWSPDASKVSFHTGGMEEKTFDCYVVELRDGLNRNVTGLPPSTRSRYKSSIPLWDLKGHFYFTRDGSLWRSSALLNKAVEVARIPGHEIREAISISHGLLWLSKDGESAVVLTSNIATKQDSFYGVDLDSGRTYRLLEGRQCYTCAIQDQLATAARDGSHVAYFVEDAQHPADLWLAGPSFTAPRRLTDLNPQFDKYELGTTRLVEWSSIDGELLHGALLLPANYREGQCYPLVVWVYGGAMLSQSIDHFGIAGRGPFNMQLLATRGYAVFLPDAPQHLGTPMVDLAKTVLPGINKLIELGIADPNRVGVMGRSYGGYNTLSLIVQTKRFKAAIDVDGYGNLIGAYGQMGSDGTAFLESTSEEGQGLMGGTPWEFRDRYIENSPIFYLNRIETPLLIVHGSDDDAIAPFLGDEVFVGLRRLGKQATYAKYQGEGHDPEAWSYANQLDFCNRVIAWFDKYLKASTPP
jgi:dipeptidyl aminopeptidase/acylaminoacyl peptidase